MEIKTLNKENLDQVLEQNGMLSLTNRVVWKTAEIPLNDEKHILVLLELYELRDMGKLKIDNCVDPRYAACADGKEELEGYIFCVFSDYVQVSKKVRTLI